MSLSLTLLMTAAMITISASSAASLPFSARGAGGPIVRSIHPDGRPDLCLTVASDYNIHNGIPAFLTSCGTGTGRQQWYMGTGATQVHLVADNNYCLDATRNIGDGAMVHLWGCSTEKPQQSWYYTDDGRLSVKDHGVCLEAPDFNNAAYDGLQVQTKGCTSEGAHQVWTLGSWGAEAAAPPPTTTTIKSGIPGVDFPSHSPDVRPSQSADTITLKPIPAPTGESGGSVELANGALSDSESSSSSSSDSKLLPVVVGLLAANLLLTIGLVVLQFVRRGGRASRGGGAGQRSINPSYAPVRMREGGQDAAYASSTTNLTYKDDERRGYSDQ